MTFKTLTRHFPRSLAVHVFSVAVGLTPFALAQAQTPAPTQGQYNCQLSGQMAGASVAVGLGGQVISGTGVVECVDSNKQTTSIPVKLGLIGGGVGFDVTIIRNLTIRSSTVQVANPDTLIRSFGLGATTGATLLATGVSFNVAAKVSDASGFGFDIGFAGQDALGLGAHLYAMSFKVERAA